MKPTVLAGDIGGTKTLLALAEADGGSVRWLHRARYPSADFADLETLLDVFVAGAAAAPPAAACLAVAGPVALRGTAQHARITNLPWVLDSTRLSAHLGAPVRLVNDFEGVARGVAHLPPAAVHTLQAGTAQAHAVQAVIGAGTGLGMATRVRGTDGAVRVLGSEGGHADFAPVNPAQAAFAHWLRTRDGLAHLSVERVVSGTGIEALYAWLAATRPDLGAALPDATAPAVSAAARAGDARAGAAMAEFVRAYGAAAGNLALTVLPFGGLYLAGGIAPANLDLLRAGAFMQAFLDKGRMRSVLERVPVHVILDTDVGLLGAARLALHTTAPP